MTIRVAASILVLAVLLRTGPAWSYCSPYDDDYEACVEAEKEADDEEGDERRERCEYGETAEDCG